MQQRVFATIFAVGLLLVVVGARCAVVARYTTDIPEWDMWDAEGVHMLLPWFQHRPMLPELFAAHNEHHSVTTKLVNFGLTLLNGKWDQRVEAVANTFLPGLIAVAFFLWARRFTGASFAVAFGAFLAAVYGLPLGWHNMIAGFHSAQFHLIMLSFAAISLLPFERPWSLRWWLGAVAATAALGTQASGLFASVVVFGLLGLRWWRREVTLRVVVPTASLSVALVVVGWVTRRVVPAHATLMAHSVGDFAIAALRNLQWPVPHPAWLAAVVWLPWIWLTLRLVRIRADAPARRDGMILCALGVWVLLQIAATSYGRGAGGTPPASRYLDTLVFGCAVNALALGWLGCSAGTTRTPRLVAAAGIAWLAVFVWGGYEVIRQSLTVDLPAMGETHRLLAENTRGYITTGDPQFLREPLPYPGADAFLLHYDHPELRRLMPASVRPAVPLEPAAMRGFLASDDPTVAALDAHATAPAFFRAWFSPAAPDAAVAREWTSRPLQLPQHSGWLIYQVYGALGTPAAPLELLDAETGAAISSVHRYSAPTAGWGPAAAPIPHRPFIVRAQVPAPAATAAFSEPVVMPRWSFIAWRVAERGGSIAMAGALLMVIAAIGLLLRFQNSVDASVRVS
ncbi:MAG TPA: hypothetical protein VHE13_05385 [Opitutus sp.]|nr:hypothetical protein [Opitutus sp.]